MVGRNITVLSNKQKYHVRTEYGEIVNSSEISNSKDEIDDVWGESNNDNVPDKNVLNITIVFLLAMIEVWLSQGSFLIILNRTFQTTNRNIMWV